MRYSFHNVINRNTGLGGQLVLLILTALNGLLRESVVSFVSYILSFGLLFSMISNKKSIPVWNTFISSVSVLIVMADIFYSFAHVEVHTILLPFYL